MSRPSWVIGLVGCRYFPFFFFSLLLVCLSWRPSRRIVSVDLYRFLFPTPDGHSQYTTHGNVRSHRFWRSEEGSRPGTSGGYWEFYRCLKDVQSVTSWDITSNYGWGHRMKRLLWLSKVVIPLVVGNDDTWGTSPSVMTWGVGLFFVENVTGLSRRGLGVYTGSGVSVSTKCTWKYILETRHRRD